VSWALRELGLDADADERAVKRAYAAKLKIIRPETDPEGFQALNEIYQAALEWLRERPAPQQTPTVESLAASNATPRGYASVKLHFEGVPISMPPFRSARREENARADFDEQNFDEQDFFFTVLEQSEQLDPQAFKRWLERNEALYSMPLKAALAEPLVWFLRDQPPLTREHLAITLAFFGLDTVNDTTMRLQEPLHRLHQTARRSGTDWEDVMSDPRRTGRSNAHRESISPRMALWLTMCVMLGLARCFGGGST
jgi:hypothetical protein